ncbi:CMRF35-like molecule 5 isoform X2 [Pseudorasbora parva]|uniref:CMRF35-like molecule 5 isoform X2 n=1 Tax=Pseudorasbora parva TaxID=51549 RepID=UPI00351E73F0
MKSYALGIWICLSGIGIPETDVTETHGSSGEHINISCSHSWASNNIKYFCRDPCEDRDILVKSDQSPKGRYTLKDYGTGTFTVTISDLQESDSGIYWCGVDRFGKDTYHKVNLTVSKGGNWDNQSTITMSSFSTSPSPDGIITNTSSATEFQSPVVSSKPAVYESTTPGYLMFTAVTLFVMVIIFGLVLCIWNMRIKKSHSSKVDAEIQGTTCPIETAGDYEEVTNFTIYSTVNKSPAANQIQDPPLYSTITI